MKILLQIIKKSYFRMLSYLQFHSWLTGCSPLSTAELQILLLVKILSKQSKQGKSPWQQVRTRLLKSLKSHSSVLLISRYILRLRQRGRCCFCAACPNCKMYLEIKSADERLFTLRIHNVKRICKLKCLYSISDAFFQRK